MLTDDQIQQLADELHTSEATRVQVEHFSKRFPGMTIVSVSHDMAGVKAVADHVLVLHEGRAVFSGSREALENTDNPYLRQFLERRTMDRDTGGDDPRLHLSESVRRMMHDALAGRLESRSEKVDP